MSEELTIAGADGLRLEARLDSDAEPRAAVVLCHPHPQMGGTMNAPLLDALSEALVAAGWAVLRFNFRGIGASEGTPGIGIDEIEDARGAVAFVRERFAGLPVAIAGWSFGAAVAARVASDDDELAAFVAVAPAVKERPGVTAGLPDASKIEFAMPCLILCAGNDDLVDPDECRSWAERANVSCDVVPGANHFFWGKYDDLAGLIIGFLEEAIS